MAVIATGNVFDLITLGVHVAYIAVVFGILQTEPEYLKVVDFWLKVFISIFLIMRFNPLMYTGKFTDFDRRVILSAGVFIFINTFVNAYLVDYVEHVKKGAKYAYGRIGTELTRGLSPPATE